MKVLCAIPALNEEVAIGSVVLRAREHVDEVLVVDDGSDDQTVRVAQAAGATVISHGTNHGKGAAYRTLWDYARSRGFELVVTLDGDGQHDADEIPLLLAGIDGGADLVIGARWGERTEMPIWRRAGKRVLDYGTAAAAGAKQGKFSITDSQSGYRAYGARALATIEPRQSGFSVESMLLIDAQEKDLDIREVPIHCRYDVDGSSMPPVRHASGVLNELLIMIGIRHPLLLIAMPGTIVFLLGAAAGIWSLRIYDLEGVFAPGWVLLALLFLILGAMTILIGMLFHLLPRAVSKALAEDRRRERSRTGGIIEQASESVPE